MTDLKQATIYFDSHIHRRLKVRAAEQGKTLSALVGEAVLSLLAVGDERAKSERPGLALEWAGALADLKDEMTSLELQKTGKIWRES